MTEPTPAPEPKRPGSLARDVAVLVLVGIALGLGHNAYLLGSGPRAGLSWIREEKKLVRLEDVLPADPVPAVAAPSGATQPGAVSTPGKATSTAPAKPAPGANAPGAASGATSATGGPPHPARGTPVNPPAGAATGPRVPSTTAAPPATIATSPPATGGTPAADVPAIPETKEPLETGLAIVRRLHAANAAVFVDARTAGEYADGHIAGAVHLSFDDVFRSPGLAKQLDDRGLPIVAYCGGGDCDLSRNLAFSLIDAGHRRVLVFLDGLPAWEQAGLPVNRGPQP